MITVKSIHEIREILISHRRAGRTFGFVPTMGALHEGHISLIRQASQQSDLVVGSIFVNPRQFNSSQDFELYPKSEEQDIAMLEQSGCNVLFLPDVTEMYPKRVGLTIQMGSIDQVLEGSHRPGHFSGVALVVIKLLNIIQPDVLWLGQKDLQQVAVVSQIIQELSFPVRLEIGATVREADGLAMSSRNRRFSREDRQLAPALFQEMTKIKDLLHKGKTPLQNLLEQGKANLEGKGFKTEYLTAVHKDTFETVLDVKLIKADPYSYHLCVAAEINGIRLIDNISLIP